MLPYANDEYDRPWPKGYLGSTWCEWYLTRARQAVQLSNAAGEAPAVANVELLSVGADEAEGERILRRR